SGDRATTPGPRPKRRSTGSGTRLACGWRQGRKPRLRQGPPAEEDGGVSEIADQCVAEEGERGDEALVQSGDGGGVQGAVGPDREICHQEEDTRPGQRRRRDDGRRSGPAGNAAYEDDQRRGAVDDPHAAVQAPVADEAVAVEGLQP